MKIGIMSMQRIRNYGSFLQSYGLKTTIESLGHEVVFVDYKVEKPIIEVKRPNILYRGIGKCKRIIDEKIFNKKDIRHLYDERYLPMLGVTQERNYRDNVDVLVIGSDEVFNCLQPNPLVGYSKELFGKDNNAKNVISYAASCGHTTLDGLKKYKIDTEVGDLLKKFSIVSVRDNNSYEVVKSITGVDPVINVDPVIISNFDKQIPVQNKLKDYILVYAYNNRINNSEEINAIKNFAQKHNKKLVSVGTHQDWTDIKIEADPFELLSYVKSADYVITDTFHGSIFSIKYNRPFATIIRESNKQKLSDLLERFDVADRRLNTMSRLEEILLSSINYGHVNEIIKRETEKSIEYLKANLKQ